MANFHNLDNAFSVLNYDESERHRIYSYIAAIMHLRNIEFEDDGDKKSVCKFSQYSLNTASQLIGINATDLQAILTSRSINTKHDNFR